MNFFNPEITYPPFFTSNLTNPKKDPDELKAEEFKRENIANPLVPVYDLFNSSREVQKVTQGLFKFVAQNSQYLGSGFKDQIDSLAVQLISFIDDSQKIQSILNQQVDERKAIENHQRKALEDQAFDARKILHSLCDLRTLGKLYLTNKMIGSETTNLLIEKVKGLKSYRFQCELLWKNRSSLGCASSWIRNAEKIKCLRFVCSLDSKWLECLSAAGDKEIEELFIDGLRLIDINNNIRDFKQTLFARRIKSLNLKIAFNKIRYDGRGLMPGPMGIAKPLLGETLIPFIFAALPNELSSLEVSGESIDHNLLDETVNELTSFVHLPFLTKLVMKKWAIKNSIDPSISFKFFHSSLRELRVTQSMNRIKNSDIKDLPHLEILEMDESLGLTSKCFKFLPGTITQLFISIWAVKVPNHNVPTKGLQKLSPDLKKLRLVVFASELPQQIVRYSSIVTKYELKFKHIQSLPLNLTSLECTWRKDVTEKNIRSHLQNLVELKQI